LLLNTLAAAAEQHRLVTAERVLLEQTLRGSVKALTDVLALVSPAAFGRAMRAQTAISQLAKQCAIAPAWPVEMAAMLSQIGCVVLPPQTLDKVYHGDPLREDEEAMVKRIPALVEDLLGNIPRLEPVREILRYQQKNYGGGGSPPDSVRGDAIPWGSRALRVVLDHDVLEAQGMTSGLAFDTLRGRIGCYDPAIIESLAWVRGGAHEASSSLVRELLVRELEPGMVFADDVKTRKGLLLIARGQEVTSSLMQRLQNFDSEVGVRQPLRIVRLL
jgi:response regulator RpfG family c-di-GMP phosphodiesterase